MLAGVEFEAGFDGARGGAPHAARQSRDRARAGSFMGDLLQDGGGACRRRGPAGFSPRAKKATNEQGFPGGGERPEASDPRPDPRDRELFGSLVVKIQRP